MSRRIGSPREPKIHRNYTVDEAARLLAVHKNTIREWIRRGLPITDRERPALILGCDLAGFLTRRRLDKKRPCAAGQIYCMRCRRPQSPAGGIAYFVSMTATSGNLAGTCPTCHASMFRRVSLAKLGQAKGHLEVRLAEAGQHIGEGRKPSVKRDFKEE